MQEFSPATIESLRTMMLGVINEAVPPLIIVPLKEIRYELSRQGMVLKTVANDVRHLKAQTRELGIKYEDLEDRLNTVIEAIQDNNELFQRVDNHENRIKRLEIGQRLEAAKRR